MPPKLGPPIRIYSRNGKTPIPISLPCSRPKPNTPSCSEVRSAKFEVRSRNVELTIRALLRPSSFVLSSPFVLRTFRQLLHESNRHLGSENHAILVLPHLQTVEEFLYIRIRS